MGRGWNADRLPSTQGGEAGAPLLAHAFLFAVFALLNMSTTCVSPSTAVIVTAKETEDAKEETTDVLLQCDTDDVAKNCDVQHKLTHSASTRQASTCEQVRVCVCACVL